MMENKQDNKRKRGTEYTNKKPYTREDLLSILFSTASDSDNLKKHTSGEELHHLWNNCKGDLEKTVLIECFKRTGISPAISLLTTLIRGKNRCQEMLETLIKNRPTVLLNLISIMKLPTENKNLKWVKISLFLLRCLKYVKNTGHIELFNNSLEEIFKRGFWSKKIFGRICTGKSKIYRYFVHTIMNTLLKLDEKTEVISLQEQLPSQSVVLGLLSKINSPLEIYSVLKTLSLLSQRRKEVISENVCLNILGLANGVPSFTLEPIINLLGKFSKKKKRIIDLIESVFENVPKGKRNIYINSLENLLVFSDCILSDKEIKKIQLYIKSEELEPLKRLISSLREMVRVEKKAMDNIKELEKTGEEGGDEIKEKYVADINRLKDKLMKQVEIDGNKTLEDHGEREDKEGVEELDIEDYKEEYMDICEKKLQMDKFMILSFIRKDKVLQTIESCPGNEDMTFLDNDMTADEFLDILLFKEKYTPSFLFSLTASIVVDYTLKMKKVVVIGKEEIFMSLVNSNLLSFLISLLSNENTKTRTGAMHLLAKIAIHICRELLKYRDPRKKNVILPCLILDSIRTFNDFPIPTGLSIFYSRAIIETTKKEFYQQIKTYILKNGIPDIKKFPMFPDMILSTDDNFDKERRWIIRILEHGLKTPGDIAFYRTNSIGRLLMPLIFSPDIPDELLEIIKKIMERIGKDYEPDFRTWKAGVKRLLNR
eukprot:GHVP01031875.1.p1 GENE.GHVP01031875.1~~GHVP01031875.1.p1  ORF type:complete len:712 (+),score=157.26 GHVP01031875.1:37-2172(+)